jgi:hypothetical protein
MSVSARATAVAVAVMSAVGCANLDYAQPPDPSSALVPGRGYVYGRFQLEPGSKTNPRLALDLTNLDSGAILSFTLGAGAGQPYLVAVAPGRYQFTRMHHAPAIGAALVTTADVRRVSLRIPRRVGPHSLPFQVEEGRAYYVGDYVGSLSQATDNYVVYAKVKTTWGLSRVAFDYEGATAELRRRYPAAASVETFPAWSARPEGGPPHALPLLNGRPIDPGRYLDGQVNAPPRIPRWSASTVSPSRETRPLPH